MSGSHHSQLATGTPSEKVSAPQNRTVERCQNRSGKIAIHKMAIRNFQTELVLGQLMKIHLPQWAWTPKWSLASCSASLRSEVKRVALPTPAWRRAFPSKKSDDFYQGHPPDRLPSRGLANSVPHSLQKKHTHLHVSCFLLPC